MNMKEKASLAIQLLTEYCSLYLPEKKEIWSVLYDFDLERDTQFFPDGGVFDYFTFAVGSDKHPYVLDIVQHAIYYIPVVNPSELELLINFGEVVRQGLQLNHYITWDTTIEYLQRKIEEKKQIEQ